MKKLLSLLILVLSVSCNESPGISKIKQRVFGNLVLGGKLIENHEIQDSLLRTDGMQLTKNSNYPYFRIEKTKLNSYEVILLFPSVFYNSDSVIKKICYFVYLVQIQRKISPTVTQQIKDIIVEKIINERERFDLVTRDFALTNDIDQKYGYRLPNIPDGNSDKGARDDIANFITQKYGNPVKADTIGNSWKQNDFSYCNELIWKTNTMDIKLISKMYPIRRETELNDFYHVLIYEFNEDIVKKYKLDKTNDLTKTF